MNELTKRWNVGNVGTLGAARPSAKHVQAARLNRLLDMKIPKGFSPRLSSISHFIPTGDKKWECTLILITHS
jgi:hypothetical protein